MGKLSLAEFTEVRLDSLHRKFKARSKLRKNELERKLKIKCVSDARMINKASPPNQSETIIMGKKIKEENDKKGCRRYGGFAHHRF